MIFFRSFFVILFLVVFTSPGLSSNDILLLEKDNDTLQKINLYFNSFINFQGRFKQIDPYGNITEGNIILQRPGKMRFEYDPPHPLLIIADGYWIGIEDRHLKRTEKYPLSKTPMSLLLNQHIDFMNDARISYFEDTGNVVHLALQDKTGQFPGKLILHFDKPDLTFTGWLVIDAQGLRTKIRLSNITTGIKVKDKLFRIDDNLELKHGN